MIDFLTDWQVDLLHHARRQWIRRYAGDTTDGYW